MSLREHFLACAKFLKKWESFLKLEPIRTYPDFCPDKISPWVDELMQKDLAELNELENNCSLVSQYNEFEILVDEIKTLVTFPKLEKNSTDSSLVFREMKKKKEHEIMQIKKILENEDEFTLIDIGGGKGHLSENLIQDKNRFSFCIDQDHTLQISGSKRIGDNNPDNSDKIKFIPLTFNNVAPVYSYDKYKKSLVLGLHACGDLSCDIIDYFDRIKADQLISVGCCYHKMTDRYNLSKLSKEVELKLTPNGFNLATRSNSILSIDDFKVKLKVRSYRYMLHCYLYKNGHKEFIPTGKTKIADYDLPFFEYALKYAKKFIDSRDDAQAYYENPKNKKNVQRIIHTDILRGLFGRVIESYLILDRAFFLLEKGYEIEVVEVFDKHLSPRNLAIIAK